MNTFTMKKQLNSLLILLGLLLTTAGFGQITISGFVLDEDNDPILDVPVLIGGSASNFTFTDASGYYEFTVPAGGDYTITPVSDELAINGVSSLDIGLLLFHLDGTLPLDSPYKMIAADTDNSGVITVADTVDIRALVLGQTTSFTNNASWRFVAADYAFPNPSNPWMESWPEIINLNGATTDQLDQNFIAIKIGDLNNTHIDQMDASVCAVSCGFITGMVYRDENANCLADGGELLLENWKVVAESATNTFVTTTTEFGTYSMSVYPADYTVTLVPPNSLWAPCNQDVAVTIDEGELEIIDFGNDEVKLCPGMEVDLGTPFLRPCFDGNYFINYCNQGTILAEDASIEVSFDPAITVTGSSIPWSVQDGNTFTFPIGDVDVNECGSITLNVFTDCETELGATLCSEAHIYPDSLCIPPSATWDGSNLTVDAWCDGDSVRFEVRNAGEPMNQSSQYFVVEDDMIMMSPAPAIQLADDEVYMVTVPANGSTWRLEVIQTPENPYNSQLSATVEACGESAQGEVSFGFVTQFPMFPEDPWHDIDCVEAIGAFDPNDKRAVPEGVGSPHYIERNTDIEYTIRFQNTGTDTAFNVVLLDTISSLMDVTTVRPGVSSHDYHFNIIDGHVLEFAFPDIMLPDSNINEAGSHGFVKFLISQKADNALGSLIENSAAIYFDFNEPVITNTAFHTVGEDFLEVVSFVTEAPETNLSLEVYPNPIGSEGSLMLKDRILTDGTFRLYDLYGRLLQEQAFNGSEIPFSAAALSRGMYLFEIYEGNQKLGFGKLWVGQR
ncbi:MAG: T9SS type A sorting domain-containing protein [Bacteroidetes bacterium]|nr:T9SS type A sorting domain-containing protein [Bacteroidota bacterium]